jgi:hypothetical protein
MAILDNLIYAKENDCRNPSCDPRCQNCPFLKEFFNREKDGSYAGFNESPFSASRLKQPYNQDSKQGFSNPFISPSYKANPMGYSLTRGFSYGSSQGSSANFSYDSPKPGFHGEYK